MVHEEEGRAALECGGMEQFVQTGLMVLWPNLDGFSAVLHATGAGVLLQLAVAAPSSKECVSLLQFPSHYHHVWGLCIVGPVKSGCNQAQLQLVAYSNLQHIALLVRPLLGKPRNADLFHLNLC